MRTAMALRQGCRVRPQNPPAPYTTSLQAILYVHPLTRPTTAIKATHRRSTARNVSRYASAGNPDDAATQQPTTSSLQQEQQQPQQQSATQEAAANSPDTSILASEASPPEPTDAAATSEPQGIEHKANNAAALQYAGIAGVHIALALAMASAAPAFAAALKPQFASPGLLLVLLGCLAASHLRAASLALFLREGAERGELFTLRYQRVNITLGIYSLLCLLINITSWNGASPALLLLGTAVSAATAAVTGLGLRRVLVSEQGLVSASGFGHGQPLQWSAYALVHYFLRDVTSLAGALLWLLVPLSASAFAQLVLAPVATAAASGVAEASDPAALFLRKLIGAGCLLLACLAHSLAESAQRSRRLDTLTSVKVQLVERLQQAHPEAWMFKLDAGRFLPLSMGLAASMVLQGYALWQGQVFGVDVNGEDILWALQYWSLLVSAVLLPVLVKQLDWSSLGQGVFRAADLVAKGIGGVVGTFYYNWGWGEGLRR